MALASALHKMLIEHELMLRNPHGFDKLRFLGLYWKFLVKHLLVRAGLKLTSERFLGYRVSFFNYRDFRSLFSEMFIRSEYAFRSQTPAPVIIDGGSNIGMSVLFFKRLYPAAKILAFEPDPATFALLQRNILLNRLDVRAENVALAEKDGTLTLYRPGREEGSLGMTTVPTMLRAVSEASPVKVKAIRLSERIAEPVDLLKLDIEGAETEVLKDLAAHKKLGLIRQLMVEFHYNPRHATNRLSEVTRILEEHGFAMVLETLNVMPPYHAYERKGLHLIIYAYRA